MLTWQVTASLSALLFSFGKKVAAQGLESTSTGHKFTEDILNRSPSQPGDIVEARTSSESCDLRYDASLIACAGAFLRTRKAGRGSIVRRAGEPGNVFGRRAHIAELAMHEPAEDEHGYACSTCNAGSAQRQHNNC